MWSTDDVNKYAKDLETQAKSRALSSMENSMLEIMNVMKTEIKNKEEAMADLEEELAEAREELDDPLRGVIGSANTASPTVDGEEEDGAWKNTYAQAKSMREDLSDQLKKELAVADNDITRPARSTTPSTHTYLFLTFVSTKGSRRNLKRRRSTSR